MTEILRFQPPVIAHRGASGYAPENTMVAFVKAAQLNVKWIEFDVMLAATGEPIVFHDEELDKTTNGSGKVGNYSFSYLRSLDAGAWVDPKFSGERIPSLTEVLTFLQNTSMLANIEIKPLPGQDKKTALHVWQEVTATIPQPDKMILFSSFSITALQTLRKESADSLMGLLMHDWLPDWHAICNDLQCASVHILHDILTAEKAKKIKDTGRLLLCYTVNDPLKAKELYSWGVDAVFTDVPDKILAIC